MRGPALAALTAMCAAGPLSAQVPDTTRVELPRLLTVPPFVYPDSLVRAGVRGLVLVRALIDTSGRAALVGLGIGPTSDQRLTTLALSYVRAMVFQPGRRNDVPVSAVILVPVEFPPPPPEARVYGAWEIESAPELVDNPIVAYPPAAARNRLEGTVQVVAVVSAKGRVEPALLQVMQSTDSVFDQAALALVRGMVYRPARRDGRPVRCVLIVPVRFRPSDAGAGLARGPGGPPPAPPTPVVPFDDVPVLVAPPQVNYPDTLRVLGIQGRVVVRAVVDSTGRVDSGTATIAMTTDSGFDQAALTAALAARFYPARIAGRPVAALVDLPIDFTLSPLDTAGAIKVAAVEEKPALLHHPPVVYPSGMQSRGITGRVLIQAIIDTTGRVEPGSVRVLESTHPAFSREARTVVLNSVYRPGRVGGRAVRVVVAIPIDFKITR